MTADAVLPTATGVPPLALPTGRAAGAGLGAAADSPTTGATPTTAATPPTAATGAMSPVTPLPILTPVAQAAPSAPIAAPVNTPETALASQLARPIFTLAAAGPGQHTVTVSLTPDALGPVTVRAHVSQDGIRVELFAPTDGGRDAIRAILPDLRKDLAQAGVSGQLDLSSQNQPREQGYTEATRSRVLSVPSQILPESDQPVGPVRTITTTSLDVLA